MSFGRGLAAPLPFAGEVGIGGPWPPFFKTPMLRIGYGAG